MQRVREMAVRPLTSISSALTNRFGLILALGCFAGCSVTSSPNYGALGLVKVSGKVTMDDKPLSGVEVQLQDPETLIYSYGFTDSAGRFSLMFDSRTPGIIPGKKLLRIFAQRKQESQIARDTQEMQEDNQPQRNISEGSAKAGARPERSDAFIPDCYGAGSKESLQIERGTSSLSIELKSDCTKALVHL